MAVLKRNQCHVAFQKETSYRLDPTGLSEDDILPFDIFESIDIPEPFKEFLEFWAVNGGRNVSDIIDEGIPPVDGTLNYEAQTGILEFYALGKCVTTPGVLEIFTVQCKAEGAAGFDGDDYFEFTAIGSIGEDVDYYVWYNLDAGGTDPAVANKTGLEVAYSTGDSAIQVAAATEAVIDALTYVGAAAGGTDTVTVTMVNMGQVTDALDSVGAPTSFTITVTQQGVDNLHTITEDDSADLPSMAVYFEQLFGTPALQDLIGTIVPDLTISMAKEAPVKGALSIKVPKSIVSAYEAGTSLSTWAKNTVGDGSDITLWPSFHHVNLFNSSNPKLKVFTWDNITFTLTLDTGGYLTGPVVASTWPCENIEIKIANDVDLLPQVGDANMTDQNLGKREYDVSMLIYPAVDIMRLLKKEDPNDYTCTLTVKIQRSIRDYKEYVFTNLFVKDYPNKIPSIDDKSLGVEATFRNNVSGALTINVKDALPKKFYEVT